MAKKKKTAERTAEEYRRMGELYLALFDPLRLRILDHLRETDGAFVNELTDAVGQPQSTVSRKLGDLRNTGLVQPDRRGLGVWYTLTPVYRELLPELDVLREKWEASNYGTGYHSRARRASPS